MFMLIKNTKIDITWSKTSPFLLNVTEVLLLLPPRENVATAVVLKQKLILFVICTKERKTDTNVTFSMV